MVSPPHVHRCLRRLRALAGPVVQLWGPPGSGRQALLEALLEAEGPPPDDPSDPSPEGAVPLALAQVEDAESLGLSLEEPGLGRARWLVCLALPEAVRSRARGLLRPGQRLVYADTRRPAPGAVPVTYLPPEELRLTLEEAGHLGDHRGLEDTEALERAWRLTGGWLVPLCRCLEAMAGDGPPAEVTAQALLAVPAVDGFFRHELPAGSSGEPMAPADPGEPPEGRARRSSRTWGWAEPPPLLVAHLARRSGLRARPSARERPQVRITLLGSLRVSVVAEDGHGDEVRWPLKRAVRILAFLAASEDLEAPRDDLVAALWAEDDEDKIERNFHPTLSHLRRTLTSAWSAVRADPAPPPLLWAQGTYRLNPEVAWWVDTAELDRLFEAGRSVREERPAAAIELWSRAAGLYRGPFLSGVYDAWVEAPRERYQRRFLDLLRSLGNLLAEQDRLTEAVDTYRRVLIEDPLRERVHLALMRIYSRQGRRDLVRRQYDRLTGLLTDELGVDPLPQTTEEYHRLMR